MRTSMLVAISVGVLLLSVGCAERKMTVVSDPPGAVVFLDGVEKGITPTTFKFNWYGDRRFVLQRDGYRICEEIRSIRPPLHMNFPLDTVWDLTPLPASDCKTVHFTLTEETETDLYELKARGEAMRLRLRGEPEGDSSTPVSPAENVPEAPEAVPESTSTPPETVP